MNPVARKLSQLQRDLVHTHFAAQPEKIVSEIKQRIPTGTDTLDALLGGGLPCGRVYELYGDQSEGKSSICEKLLISCQKAGGMAGVILSEPAISLPRLERQGCVMGELLITEPDTLEQGFEELIRILKRKMADDTLRPLPGLFIWDTLPSAPLKSDLEDSNPFASGMMAKPRMIRRGLETVGMLLARSQTSLIGVSQTIQSPKPYTPVQTGGGGGLKFWSSARFHVRRKQFVADRNEVPHGILVNVRITKNKIEGCLVQRDAPIYIRHKSGVDNDLSSFYFLQEDVFEFRKKRHYLNMPGRKEPVVFKWDDYKKVLKDNPDIRKFLRMKVREKMATLKAVPVPGLDEREGKKEKPDAAPDPER